MMRLTLASLIAFVLALVPGWSQDRAGPLGEAVEVARAVLDKPEIFDLGGGETLSTAEIVIVSVEVLDLTPFLPRGAEAPVAVIDGAVAKELVSPLLTGRLILAAPAPPPGGTISFSLLPPGMGASSIARLPKERLLREAQRGTDLRRLVPSDTPPLRLDDLGALRARLAESGGRIAP